MVENVRAPRPPPILGSRRSECYASGVGHEGPDERRRHARVPASCTAWLWLGDITLHCPVVNLSAGGLQVRAPLRFGLGSIVDLAFDLGPDHGTVRGRGRIAWSQGVGPEGAEPTSHTTGVELTDLVAGREGLDRYLQAS